ncbi:ferrichrome-binding protein [Halogranum rubrum]|uniref:Ferrichrome-binding protein n=1 Tax=Halogranum rubrum TaxID=553466 RepID=A0A1I4BXU5_9EURY|nr:ABC transporter substrate-binding protein [Halogranum rubrum]SFK73343.1 ferrichrome-binding protein [Halogranum rubrum]
MNEERTTPTRRDYLKGGSALLAGSVLAGCLGGSQGDSSTTEAESTADTTNGTSETSESTESGASSPYSVTMSPMGDVEFDAVPEDAFVVFPQYADMAVALGHGDAVNSVYVPEMSGKTMNTYYDRLDGVSFEWEGLPDPLAEGMSKEQLYSLDSDVHFVDPAYVSTQDNWDQSDLDDISSSVGPWFGNFYSGTNNGVPEGYSENYEFYSLWDMFGKVADVFQERERYQALQEIHANAISTIEENLPPKEERPTAVRVTMGEEQFYTYHLNKPGYWLADTRPLGANDAFSEEEWPSLWGTVDYETMLEADPDVILHLWGVAPDYYIDGVREKLQNHPVGSELSAVKNDRVFAAGMRYQGPIMNLFQLEMGAKQLYPDQFGEWPGYVPEEPYPEIPAEEQLFDRERLANVVNGEF